MVRQAKRLSISSTSHSLKTFGRLFLISGIAALSALIILDIRTSVWTRIRNLLGIFFQRDLIYRISRQIERNDHSGINLPEFVTPSPPVDSAYTELPGDPS